MEKPYYKRMEEMRNLTSMQSRKAPKPMQYLAVIIAGGILFFIGWLIVADANNNIFLYAYTKSI